MKADVDACIEAQLKEGYAVDANGCWLWQGGTYENGYGRLSRHLPVASYHSRAHIASYQFYKGVVAKGLFMCHTCDVKKCMNPEHLWLGTNQDNQIDARDKGVFDNYWTEERRSEQSARMSGTKNPMYGRTGENAPAYKRTGEKHPMYGTHHSEEAKLKISKRLLKHYEEK